MKHPHEYASIAVDEKAEDRKAFNYPFGIGAMYKKQFMIGDKNKMYFPYMEQMLKMTVKKAMRKARSETILKRFRDGFGSYGENQGDK